MKRSSTSLGLVIGLLAALAFGMSGAFIKPLLEAGWSPAAAVTVRALLGGIVLLPFALVALRGRGTAVWRGRWRIAAMGFIGVAAHPARVLRVAAAHPGVDGDPRRVHGAHPAGRVRLGDVASHARRSVVLIGSVVSIAGLVLVVSPGAEGALDLLGLIFAALAAVGCAIYYVVAARPSDGLPPVALAGFGLLLGGVSLGLVGADRPGAVHLHVRHV